MELIKTILVVGAGSFLGGAGRYLVSLAFRGIKGFPWVTLAVNLAGCFLIGLLWGVFSKNGTEGSDWALFLTVGFCGGFTTFSTFSKEALMMLQGGSIRPVPSIVLNHAWFKCGSNIAKKSRISPN